MSIKPLLIVKTGSTVPQVAERRGDFEDWMAEGTGLGRSQIEVVSVYSGEALPEPGRHPAVLVTGSAAMVTDHEPWSDRTAAWLAEASRTGATILGVCYGHQLLALGRGGRIGVNPRGREIGTVDIELTEAAAEDPLLRVLPSPLRVQATHREAVLDLPSDAVLLGGNAMDPHQIFRLGDRAWGVQFHPEFDADIIRGYIAARREAIAGEGLDPDALQHATLDGDHGRRLLRRFAELAVP
ncbi:MAG: glutamine amidotransferase [Myxococcota bacterium]